MRIAGFTAEEVLLPGGARYCRTRVVAGVAVGGPEVVNSAVSATEKLGTDEYVLRVNDEHRGIHHIDVSDVPSSQSSLSCTPYGSFKECTSWSFDHNAGWQMCGCYPYFFGTESIYHRNCKNCSYTDYYCSRSSCGSWNRESRRDPLTCSDWCG